MPTISRREDDIVLRFLSAYENHSWTDAKIEWLDKIMDGAVEARATRTSDGKIVAIEHTIIEPFVGDKRDFAKFEAAFLEIERDKSLLVPGRWISVFIPIGTLEGCKEAVRRAIVEAVHAWVKANRLALPNEFSKHPCVITGVSGKPLTVTLHVRVVAIPGQGVLHIRRQQINDDLGDVVEKALQKKLPKLVSTAADKRILILERQHMNLYPERMLEEIEKRRVMFPSLDKVEEIWIVETIFYERESHLRFERYANGTVEESLNFYRGEFLGTD